jgi:hypothetical protein
MDEPTGSGAWDSFAGRGLNQESQGSGTGVVGSGPGIINGSRYFSGNTNFYRQSRTDYAPGANHFFVSFWIRAGSLTQNRDASLIGKWGNPDWEWLLYYNNKTNQINLSVSSTGHTYSTVISTTAITSTMNWYFIAAGWDGTNIKISVNGGPYATASFAGPVYNGGYSFFSIGSESNFNCWLGYIDEVALWIGRTDLTISDVQQLYNNGVGIPFSSFQ